MPHRGSSGVRRDVPAAEALGPDDGVYARVSQVPSLTDVGRSGADGQHASPRGLDRPVGSGFRAGVEHRHARAGRCVVEASDNRTALRRVRIAPSGHHHGDRGLVAPAQVEGA